MINFAIFPRNRKNSTTSDSIIYIFNKHCSKIESPNKTLTSNEVLKVISKDLIGIGFKVESGKKTEEKIKIPVLYGNNGKINRSFEADAFLESEGYVLEVEAGRGVTNYQFLKDLFQAIAMQNVSKLCIAVRNDYRDHKNFEYVVSFFDTLYASGRVTLPFEEILIIGY